MLPGNSDKKDQARRQSQVRVRFPESYEEIRECWNAEPMEHENLVDNMTKQGRYINTEGRERQLDTGAAH